MNISVGTESIFVGTRPAGGPGSRLHDSIIMCSIAPKTDEIFKKSECRHWAPKFDTGARNVIWIFLFHFSFVSSAS